MAQAAPRRKPRIMWQLPMKRVLYALVPAVLAAVYFFGWRVLAVLAVVNAAGILAEYLFTRRWNEPVNSSVIVTNVLFTLTLPPTVPLWMAVVGIVVGVVFGKMVFGGFGRNVFNPALVGRAFIYVSFPVAMTGSWVLPAGGAAGGFARYAADAVTQATPLSVLSDGGTMDLLQLLLGTVAGSMGETSALLLVAGGIYLLWTKTASYQVVLGVILSATVLQGALWAAGSAGNLAPHTSLLAGGFMLGTFFMATDPISLGQTTPTGKWLYGIFIGCMTVVIRTFSIWDEGMMFAILLANMFSPITEYALKARAARIKTKTEAAA